MAGFYQGLDCGLGITWERCRDGVAGCDFTVSDWRFVTAYEWPEQQGACEGG
jgi:hypothetical protein